ncbi:MAG: CHAT domain-containing tetratricopeptide repeat protein [Cyclobacteriaceae bacterium]
MSLKYFIFISLLLLLTSFTADAQNSADTVLAQSYSDAGDSLVRSGNYRDASVLFKKSSDFFLNAENEQKYTAALNRLSRALMRINQLDSAEKTAEKVIQMGREDSSSKDEQTTDAIVNMATILIYRGKYQQSIEKYAEALEGLAPQNQKDSLKVASALNNTGVNYYYLGDYEQALHYYSQALKIREEIWGENHQHVAASYNNIGIIYETIGHFQKAEQHFKTALRLQTKLVGENHPWVSNIYAGLGNLASAMGEDQSALDFHFKALSIIRRMEPVDKRSEARDLNNIGITFYRIGDLNQALKYHLEALEIRKKTPEKNHPDLAHSYNNVGLIFLRKGEHKKALKFFQRSQMIRLEAFHPTHIDLVSSYNNIGEINFIDGNLEEALNYFGKVLEVRRANYSGKDPDAAYPLNFIGRTKIKFGRTREALHSYQAALITNSLEFADSSIHTNPPIKSSMSHRFTLESLNLKGQAFEQLYKEERNVNFLQYGLKSYQTADSLLQKAQQDHLRYEDKISIGDIANEVYGRAVQLCIYLHQITGEHQYQQLAFAYSEKNRGTILAQNVSDKFATKFAGIPDSLLQTQSDLKANKSFYESRITDMKVGTRKMDSAKYDLYQNRLFGTNQRLDSMKLVFEQNFPKYKEAKYEKNSISLESSQDKLSNNQAILEYSENDSIIYAFVITKESFSVQKINKKSVFDLEVDKFQTSFDPLFIQSEPNAAYNQFTSSAFALYDKLLAPILSNLSQTINHLILIPDGELSYLPWELFIQSHPQSEQGMDYKQLDYLLNSYTISYAHSASLLFQEFSRAQSGSSTTVLAFAPSYPDTLSSKDYTNLTASLRDGFSKLKWTKSEIMKIEENFNGSFLYGDSATEKNFKEQAADYKILHLAMHAWVDNQDPMLSKLLFSPNEDSLDDDMLHTHELYNMNLTAEMVVLSACKTGLGKTQKGEGVMSLGRAFAYAGCPSVVMSHWSVDDKSTAQLMGNFYKHIADGQSKDKALRQAKIDFLNGAEGLKTHPYFWGGFVVVGNTDPISKSYSSFIFILLVIIMVVVPTTVFLMNKRKPAA